jgi:hypothetical protein
MTVRSNFNTARATGFDARTFCASFRLPQQGGTNVDLSLRLNVMAVTAVFLFVGAILLGAF